MYTTQIDHGKQLVGFVVRNWYVLSLCRVEALKFAGKVDSRLGVLFRSFVLADWQTASTNSPVYPLEMNHHGKQQQQISES